MVDLLPLPTQPDEVPWPTRRWPRVHPTALAADGVDVERLERLLDEPFTEQVAGGIGHTFALVLVHRGRLASERYGERSIGELATLAGTEPGPVTPDDRLLSWSMAKSVVHAAVGLAVRDGHVSLHEPCPVPEWAGAGDPRGAITWHHLLTMTSGLRFSEVYDAEAGSDVVEMLFGAGKADVAAFAAGFPLAHPPGTVSNYSSGTTNIVARALQRVLGVEGDADGIRAFLAEELFDPIGMHSARVDCDDAGTFVGSSYVHATATDFARFGLLYLRDGVWDGRRLLPVGWVDHARTRTPASIDAEPYGAHWWLSPMRPGTFSAMGYEGQRIMVVPDLDVVLVRLGRTDEARYPALDDHLHQIIDCLGA